MKKFAALLLALVMILSLGACGTNAETKTETPNITPTPAPTPEPEWEAGVIRAGYLGGVMDRYQRGDEVTVIGTWEDFYVIEGESCALLVENQFLRPLSETAPEEETGYTRAQTQMFATGYLRGKLLNTLNLNTKVTVVDKKGSWALIRLADGTEGYVKVEQLSKWYINAGAGGGSGGGGGGGAADGTDVNLGNISAVLTDRQASFLEVYEGKPYEKLDEPEQAVVLSAETEGWACLFSRNDEVRVTEVTEATEDAEAFCTLWVDDYFVTVPRWAVWMEGDALYEAWSAYGRWGGIAYTEVQQWYEMFTFGVNERIEVVDELSELGLYVVEADGAYGYVPLNFLAKTRYVPAAGGSGGGGGGSTGWTPPVM